MSEAKEITAKLVDMISQVEGGEKPSDDKLKELEMFTETALALVAIIVPVLVKRAIDAYKAQNPAH